MRIGRRLTSTHQPLPENENNSQSLKNEVFLATDFAKLIIKKQPQPRDLFQDAWKDMHESAKDKSRTPQKVRETKSTLTKVAHALKQRESTKVSKPVAVILTKPSRLTEKSKMVDPPAKKDPEKKKKKHKSKKSREERLKKKREKLLKLLQEDGLCDPKIISDMFNRDDKPSRTEPSSPLSTEKPGKPASTQTPSEGTAESTQAPDPLENYPLIVLDDTCASVGSGLSCFESLGAEWGGGYVSPSIDEDDEEQLKSDDAKSNSGTDDEDDDDDSWGSCRSRLQRVNIFSKSADVCDDEESISSTALVSHDREDDSSLETDRESDDDSLSNAEESTPVVYNRNPISSSYHSRRLPLFQRSPSVEVLQGPNA